MDITRFNKELGNKIAIAKRFERKGDIKAAIQEWVEISEMALNFSKSPKIDATFKNMIINRTKGIFLHIKNLKERQSKKEKHIEDLISPIEELEAEISSESIKNEDTFMQEEKISDKDSISKSKIVDESEFKNLPKGFKEIETSEDFTIITPHDEDFVKKKRAKVEDGDYFKPKEQIDSTSAPKPEDRKDFEQQTDGKNLICFACGYDRNGLNDKICKNCKTSLN
jgi:hypothetical protein